MADRLERLPRTAVASMVTAIVSHLWAVLTGLGVPHHIPPLHWLALAAAELVLVVVMIERPGSFYVRRFRLPALAVTGLALLIFVPLPGVVRLYGEFVPELTILSIAVGLVVFAMVFLVAGEPPIVDRSTPAHVARESGVPISIMVLALLVLPIWLRSLGSLPIIELFTGRARGADIALARGNALNALTNLPLRLTVGALRNLYLMFAVGWLVADLVSTPANEWRDRSRKRIALTIALGVASVYALVTTERAIIGQVGVVAVIAYLIARRRDLSPRAVVSLAAVGLAFPLAFGLANSIGGGGSAIGTAVESVRRRLFFVPADVMVHYFGLFPGSHEFLGGASIPKVQRLFGGETFDLSTFVYESSYRFDERLTGLANGSFIGVGWANFGFLGVVAWFFVTAIALVAIDRIIDRLPRRSSAALRGVAGVQAVLLTSVDISRSLLNFAPGFLDLLVAVAVVTWLSGRTRLSGPAPNHAADAAPRPTASPPAG